MGILKILDFRASFVLYFIENKEVSGIPDKGV